MNYLIFCTRASRIYRSADHVGGFDCGGFVVYAYTPALVGGPPNSEYSDSTVPVEQTITYKDSLGSTVQTVAKTWVDQYLMSKQTTTTGSLVSETDFKYGAGAQVTEEDDYDFGSGTRGALLRTNCTSYHAFSATPIFPAQPSIVDRPNSVIISSTANCTSPTTIAETDYTYDGHSLAPVTATQHDDAVYPTTMTSPRGNATTITKKCLQSCSNAVTSVSYDQTGQVATITDPNLNVSTYSFTDSPSGGNAAGNSNAYLTQVTRPPTGGVSHVTKYEYNYPTGELAESIDENNQPTNFTYSDLLNRLTEVQGPPDPNNGNQRPTTSYQYDDTVLNAKVTTSVLLNTSGTTRTTTQTLDGLGQAILTELVNDPIYTATTYDGLGRVYRQTTPYRSTTDASYGYDTTIYDALNRPLSVTHKDGSSQSLSYSANQSTSTDEDGNQWRHTGDALGRLTHVLEPNGTAAAATMQTDYGYDALGNLSSVTQWGGASGSSGAVTRSFSYNSLSRLVQAFNPESGWTCYGTTGGVAPNGSNCTGSYDANGNLLAKTDGRGFTNSYTYDALNRKTQESPTAPNTETHSFYYDQASVYGISTTNPIGRLTMETTTFPSFSILSAATIYWNHDPIGRVSGVKECTETSCNGGNPASSVWYNLNYTYDLAGNRTSYTDGLSTTINENYDSSGRLATVSSTNGGSTVTRWTANSYGPIGLTQATFGNGTVESRSYDNRERMYSIGLKNGAGQTIYSEGLTFDLASNAKTANDLVNGSWTYHYDTLNRLSTAVASTTGPNAGEGCLYGYDPFGNRSQESSFQGTCFSPAPFTFTGNRINGYCYDSAGNLVDLGTCPSGNHQFFYDGYENLLSPNFNSVSRNSYAVNSQGQRISKYSSGTIVHQYLYGLDQDSVTELDGQGNWVQTNVRAGGLFLLELQSTGATYLHTDHLGTIRLETNSTGTVVETCTNLPFNEALACNSSSNPAGYHFTSKEHDQESGNDYFGTRYYASSIGRFMSPDSSGLLAQKPEDPQSWNLYAYARNNPLMYLDPSGLDCVYANNAGNRVESIDHNSNSGECGQNGGSWVPGYAAENWAHFNNTTEMFQVGSIDISGDGNSNTATVDYTMFGAGDNTGFNANDTACSGCAGFASANANWLSGQLSRDGVPGLDGYIRFLTGREEPVKPGIVKDLSAPLDISTDHWAGPGGMGPPGGRGDWAASVHDYSFFMHDITIQNTGHYFGLHVSPETAKALIQSNNTLIRNAGGVQGIKMGIFFGIVNAYQWYASSWK